MGIPNRNRSCKNPKREVAEKNRRYSGWFLHSSSQSQCKYFSCPGTTIRTGPCPSKLFICSVNSFPLSILLCSSSASVTENRSATPAVSCIDSMGLSAEIASLLLWRSAVQAHL
ncbi:hypothetical protein GBA52_006211 [Prunus armeniaca]|nr:hypothetical protein GBA52_006211 [Prunus armeniaca]